MPNATFMPAFLFALNLRACRIMCDPSHVPGQLNTKMKKSLSLYINFKMQCICWLVSCGTITAKIGRRYANFIMAIKALGDGITYSKP